MRKDAAYFRGEPARPLGVVTPTAQKLMEKYTELQYIGGSFADVFRAVRKDGSVIAVKAPRNLDERTEDFFFRELNTWQQLKHRNIASLIRASLNPVPHFEMEYVDGENLDDALRGGSFDVEDACKDSL